MVTRVVNLRAEPFDVYIGRAGKGLEGYFGNPYRVGARCFQCQQVHGDGASTIACFREYFERRLHRDQSFRRRVDALKGKTLGCFCKPNACHGDVIVEYLEGLKRADHCQE